MKLGRFWWEEEIRYGAIQGDQVLSLSGNIFEDFEISEPLCGTADVRFLPPVEPRSIVAVGINYARRVAQHYGDARHTERYKGPVLFLMPTSSVIGHLDQIVVPTIAEQVGAAGELVAVMKRQARSISESEVGNFILGYTCGNDLASSDLFEADSQQTLRAHGFDTATSIGPYIDTAVSPNQLEVVLRINGNVVSAGNTSDMIYDVNTIVSYITQFMTLQAGDIIFMGTPMGASVNAGDIVEVDIEGIGVLKNEVVSSR